MGIEEEKQAGQSVFGFEGVVVQESASGVPSVLVVQRLGRAAPAVGGGVDAGQLVGAGPADEVARGPAVGGRVVTEPAVEVALSAGGQGEVMGGEPAQEGDGRVGVLADGVELLRSGGSAVVLAA